MNRPARTSIKDRAGLLFLTPKTISRFHSVFNGPFALKKNAMEKSNDQRRLAKPASYKLWVGVFWLLVLLVAGGFYYATQKIAYTWRWNRVPIYFAYKDTIEIISDIDGNVESITKSGKEAVITVKGDEECRNLHSSGEK